MRVTCINSSGKPAKIPASQWIKQGEEYTVTEVVRMGIQKDKYGFLLAEVQLGPECFPYEYYDADRFRPVQEVVVEVKEELEEAI